MFEKKDYAVALEVAVKSIKARLESREFHDPEVGLSISTKDWRMLVVDVQYKVRGDSVTTYKSFYGDSAEHIDTVLQDVHVYIDGLKSKAELEHEEFMTMLGRVMDRAKEMGVSEELFINPLTAMMVELSTNALEHHK